MSGPCRGACVEPEGFPAPVENRPGLPRIAARTGTYPSIRRALLRRLDLAPELAAWTHRAADDPGIALLEGAAIVGDILTLYHEAYANEAYLRTARWRESVAGLVRLTGYRLAPGVAGRAAFAFEVGGAAPVSVPAGFPLTAEVTGAEGAVDWETAEPLEAWPALSRFSLYRPFAIPPLGPATAGIRVTGPDGDAADLRPGDRLLLGDALPAGAPTRLDNPEIVVIDAVRTLHGRPLYTIRGSLARAPGPSEVTAYRLGRSFRHFGYDGPPTRTVLDGSAASQLPVAFTRQANVTETVNVDPPLEPNELPLDAEVHDLARGATVVVQTGEEGDTAARVRSVEAVRQGAFTWGAVTGGSTVLALSANLDLAASTGSAFSLVVSQTSVANTLRGGVLAYMARLPVTDALADSESSTQWQTLRAQEPLDVRGVVVHETVGPRLTVQAEEAATAAASGTELFFLGTAAEAAALAGRRLLLEGWGDEAVETTVAAVAPAPAGEDARRILRGLSLDRAVDYAAFPHEAPFVTVYGNVARATQGKREGETVLGSGDAREAFQTFPLPKAPLTYLVSPGAAPPEVPELTVCVAGRAWTRVPSLFGRGPRDEVYVVREDAAGKSLVQFGDGVTGARLPSGVGNVAAAYRVGSGAFGALRAGTGAVAGARLEGLDAVRLPGVASGGEPPESAANARAAAPGRVRSLDRLVSLADFEAEALAMAGVWRAAAAWEVLDGVPSLVLTVLMKTGRQAELAAVRHTLAEYDRCRGMQRFPVVVAEGALLPVSITARYAPDPTYREADVRNAVEVALGASRGGEEVAGGLFWPGGRRFGAREYATRVEAVAQGVAGVAWIQVTGIGVAGLPPAGDGVVPCPARHVLSLDAADLRLSPVLTPSAECAR